MKIFKSKSDVTTTIVCGAIAIFLAIVTVVGNVLAFDTFRGTLESFFGMEGAGVENYDTDQYFERHAPSEEAATNGTANLGRAVVAEGAVLLKNDNNVLPLSKGAKVSCFSASSVDIIYGSIGGSGAIGDGAKTTLKETLEQQSFVVNPTLWSFYTQKNSKRKVGGLAQSVSYYEPHSFAINEIPYAEYTKAVKDSYKNYNDAAIVVIARSGCENGDLPRSMSKATAGENEGSILELDADEKKMMEEVSKNFDKVIVLLNTSNAVECGFLDDYNVDSCLWIGGVGQYGLTSVGRIIAGEVNPSGRLVDTYAYDAFSSPAMQNMGNFEYWTEAGVETEHHYYTYAEGIYVGYKYYETRYEDAVLNQGNAGDYTYDEVVQFPFGYGISYTEFEWSDFSAKMKDDKITVKVTVKNVGNVRGKDVVQVYYQSPYTKYDKDNGVEKAAVNLVGFAKTSIIQPGGKETVTVTFDVEDMKSYDAKGKGTYYLEASTSTDKYYITAGKNSHAAIENILKAKGANVEGDASLVESNLNVKERTYNEDTVTGKPVENLFEDADGSAYHDDIKYLSRSDWSVMNADGLRFGTPTPSVIDMDGLEYRATIPESLKKVMELEGYAAAGAPDEEFTTPVQGKKGDKKLISMKGKDFNDPEWQDLLDQATVTEMVDIVRKSGHKSYAMESVGKPYQTDVDGPQAWTSFIGNGISSGGLPFETVVASTWNSKLAEQVGYLMGELCLWSKKSASTDATNLTGWYAPAMNIHRTPFGGRNFEYYSEDAVISGIIGSQVVKGATSRGVMCFIKHFAMNEQERNRMTDNATWAEEQAIREIYLRPFEISIKEGGSLALMTSYNRIGATWAGGHYNLITGVLRKEWGFNGFVISDYMDGDYENVDQMLAAGGDAALNLVESSGHATVTCTTTGAQALTYMRRAIHHLLYSVVNSNAMNGIDGATKINKGTPIYYRYMTWINIGLGVLIVVSLAIIPLKLFVFGKRRCKVNDAEEGENL